MVFKKPYAFLIKHFKLIHLILTAIYIFLAFKVSSILTYYNNFISGKVGKINAINYTRPYYLIAIILSIIICVAIFILMHHKKKPKLMYIILILLYIIITVVISLAINGLNVIYFSILEAKTLRLYRDLLRLILIVQYITIVMALIRGLGFDIKKFDFVKDLNEMNIEITDGEEVELTLNGTNTVTRKIRRKIRELKYYYIENKIFINIVITILVILVASTISIDINIINKVYSENEVFSTDAFDFQVLNTYVTNKSYNNQTINTSANSFIIINLQINPHSETQELNTSNIILQIENNSYSINNKSYEKFKDIGVGFNNQKISSTKKYLFIYVVPNNLLTKKMTLIYAGIKKVKLNPINLDQIDTTTSLKLADTIDLTPTILASGSITINSYELNNKFSYEYNYDINGETHTITKNLTSTSNTILKLNITSSLDVYDIITNYGKIKYNLKGIEYTSKLVVNKTPTNYKEGLYLEVDKDIEQAENIYLELNVRNKKYIYTLK